MPKRRRSALLALIGPGLLLAATGVGAGDLATAGFAGSRLGPAVLWAVAVGAFLKFVLTEGLARWQLSSNQTLLEGAMTKLGPIVSAVFILYLLPWSFFVGAALISACGVTAHSLFPIVEDPATSKLVYGVAHSAVGVVLVWAGGFRLFEKLMAGAISVMFVSVIVTALLSRPDWAAIGAGLLVPRIPAFDDGGLTWTIALMGGVGGTLTILCYGYWIREAQRTRVDDLRTCRIDLALGYAATALFGMAMIVIASGLTLEGAGTSLMVSLAGAIETRVGAWGRWVFLIGAWAAVFSSLLGVWQAVPYIFADYCGIMRRRGLRPHPRAAAPSPAVNTRGRVYRGYLLALAAVPLVQISHPFHEVQKYYAVIGAAFVPLLALALVLLNGREKWIGRDLRNRPWTTALLLVVLALSVLAGYLEIRRKW